MNKTYQLKTLDTQGQSRTQTLEAGSRKAPLLVPTAPGERHLLLDVQQGSAPDNIRLQRAGKHLRVFFDGSSQPDLVLENFYSGNASDEAVTLAGTTDQGGLYAYQPETGRVQDTVSQLTDNAPPQGMALGGAPLAAFTETVAAAGLLAPVAAGGLGIGAIGAGLLGVAAIGGGGGGGSSGSPVDPNSTAGTNVLIKSLSFDSGRNASDFITNDNTLVFKGSLEHFTANGDRVQVKLKDSTGKVINTAEITPSGNQWVWDLSSKTLSDGNYTLEAQLVDPSGAPVSKTHSDSQALQVDTSVRKTVNGESDPNADLQLSALNMLPDTQIAGDWFTNSTTPAFSGDFGSGKAWSSNGDLFRFQIFNARGELVTEANEAVMDNSKSTWSSGALNAPLTDGTYLARAIITDLAGNVISQEQHALVIDHTPPGCSPERDFSIVGSSISGGGTRVTQFTLTPQESVTYTISKAGTVVASGHYDGTGGSTGQFLIGTYTTGQLQISFTDTAGNVSSFNSETLYDFSNRVEVVLGAKSAGYVQTPNLQNLGSFGIHTLQEGESLDLSTLILDAKLNPMVHNTLDMLSDSSAQSLSLSLNDVLSVGVCNSFINDGRVQLLVKGHVNDTVNFEDLTAWHNPVDTMLNGVHYRQYVSTNDLAEVLIQQDVLMPTS